MRDHVRANLARFKVPRDVTFVDELPRNATGELLRNRLGELIRLSGVAQQRGDVDAVGECPVVEHVDLAAGRDLSRRRPARRYFAAASTWWKVCPDRGR